MSGTFARIGVLGAGAWGTALALTAFRAGRQVTLWAHEPEVVASLAAGRGNPLFLPDIEIPAAIGMTGDLAPLGQCDLILAVTPARHLRALLARLSPNLRPDTLILICAKGIERDSLKFMAEIAAEAAPGAVAGVLSGPSFASDVARGLPTAVTLACADETLGRRAAEAIGHPGFRPYWTDDVIGAEIGGAVKNVLAIGAGIVEGLGLGRSAHAALIARGFAEMSRLGIALGGRAETLAGLSGLGDLVLTCSSPQSRNMSFGLALAAGEAPGTVLAARRAVTEGAETAPALIELARRHGIEMPIAQAVNAILTEEMTVPEAMERLLARPFRAEAR